MYKKLIPIILLTFLVIGQIEECAYQKVCNNEYIKDRVVFNMGDIYNVCENCSCEITLKTVENKVIELDKTMEYLDSGYYGYEINDNYYPNNNYVGYITCVDDELSLTGSSCIDFYVKECYEDITDNVVSSSGLIGSDLINDEGTLSKSIVTLVLEGITKAIFGQGIGNYISDIYNPYLEKINNTLTPFYNGLDIVLIILSNLFLFLGNPTIYLMENFYPYIKTLFYSLIISSFIFYVGVELMLMALSLSKVKDGFFKWLQYYCEIHANLIDFGVKVLTFIFTGIYYIITSLISGLNMINPIGK